MKSLPTSLDTQHIHAHDRQRKGNRPLKQALQMITLAASIAVSQTVLHSEQVDIREAAAVGKYSGVYSICVPLLRWLACRNK